MEHQYEVCTWLLHAGNQQCITVCLDSFTGFKKLLCLLCATPLEGDEVVVRVVDSRVPKSICRSEAQVVAAFLLQPQEQT